MIRHLNGMIDRDPHDVEAMHALAVTYYERKNLEGARRILEQAVAAGGDKNIEVFTLLMDVLKEMDRYAEAIQYCERGLAANPGKWKRLHLVKGIMHLNLDEEGEARQEFEQVKDEYVLETQAHQALGEWLQAKGRYKEAYQELTLAMGDRQHAADIEQKLKALSDLIQKEEGGDKKEK
jgi:tetratricopeptide (TPR) repeat protein